MKFINTILLIVICGCVFRCGSLFASDTSGKPRLIVLADMGNEPDEMQQILHLLICSHEVDLEGLLAVTGKHLRPGHPEPYRRVLHPELFHQLIDGYAQVYPNIQQHASGWSSYSSPLVIKVNGQSQAVVPGTQWCVAYNVKTGEEIWRLQHSKGLSLGCTPIAVDGKVIIATGYGGNDLVAIDPTGSGDVTNNHVAGK